MLLESAIKQEASNLSAKLSTKNARQILHHVIAGHAEIPVCPCGVCVSWNSDKACYRKYCSTACTATYTVEEKKRKNLETLGVEWHTQDAVWSEKIKQTSLEKFGAEHYSKTSEFKNAVKRSNLEKYGVEHASQCLAVKEKAKSTWETHYGVQNPMHSPSIRQKMAETTFCKLGVYNAFHSLEIQNKIKQTNLAKYGFENPRQNLDVQARASKSYKENFYQPDTLEKLLSPKWLFEEHANGKTVAEIADRIGVSPSNLSKYFQKYNIDIVHHRQTYAEKKLLQFLNENNIRVIQNDRTVLSPKELDFLLPDYNLAIEINGVYWHTEQFNKHPYYHYNKTKECAEQGIELWQFWDYEMETLWGLITDKILSKTQIQQEKIGARKLLVGLVDTPQKSKFFKKNHLQADCGSSINLGLLSKSGELVMCASFKKSRFSKRYKWELIRLATKRGTIVVGGASRLINRFVKDYMMKEDQLVSYCNRRFSTGHVYQKIGFTCVSTKTPGYVYTKGNRVIGSRQQWQKHKLSTKLQTFDNSLSEVENMSKNSCYRLWDCGQDTWVLIK